jgi:hypothetical protein
MAGSAIVLMSALGFGGCFGHGGGDNCGPYTLGGPQQICEVGD